MSVRPNADQFAELAAAPDDAPVVMLNLLKFKARADGGDAARALSRGEAPARAEASASAPSIMHFVVDALRWYFEFHDRYDGFYGAFIHDPLVVAAALDRSLVRTEAWFVDVETRGELTSGMTVADRRRHTGQPPNADVAVWADSSTFLERLIERVGALATARGI